MKNKVEKVSIIVPVYNVEKYLIGCIDSILNQTYKNYELILVDDGSKDSSGEICDEYARKYSNITVIHQNNQGQAVARNHGVQVSSADWILFVDSDDVIHPHLLEFLIRAIHESQTNSSFSGRIVGKTLTEDFFYKKEFSYNTITINDNSLAALYDSKMSQLNEVYWLIYPKLIKKEIIQKYPFVEGRIFEDNEVACKWLVESGSIAVLSEKMYFYTDNPNGTMNQPLNEKKLDYLWALEEQIKFYEELHYVKMCKKITTELISSTLFYYNRCKTERNDKLLEIVIKDLKHFLKQYRRFIEDKDKAIERKTDRILKPRIYRVKKLLKIY